MSMRYHDYIKSNDWRGTKKYFKKLSRKSCYVCGSKDQVALHHKHYKTVGYEDGSELVWLCIGHHREVHFKEGFKEVPDTDESTQKLIDRLELMKRNWAVYGEDIKRAEYTFRKQEDEFVEMARNF